MSTMDDKKATVEMCQLFERLSQQRGLLLELFGGSGDGERYRATYVLKVEKVAFTCRFTCVVCLGVVVE